MTSKILLGILFLFIAGCVASDDRPMILSEGSAEYLRPDGNRKQYYEGKITLQEYVQGWEDHIRSEEELKAHEQLDEESQSFFDFALDETRGIPEPMGSHEQLHNDYWASVSNKFKIIADKHVDQRRQEIKAELVTLAVAGFAILPLSIATFIGIRRWRKNKN